MKYAADLIIANNRIVWDIHQPYTMKVFYPSERKWEVEIFNIAMSPKFLLPLMDIDVRLYGNHPFCVDDEIDLLINVNASICIAGTGTVDIDRDMRFLPVINYAPVEMCV